MQDTPGERTRFMEDTYREIGGIRYGDSFWRASNYTWPFATLAATPSGITISVSVLGLWKRVFTFDRSSIRSIARKRGVFSVGAQIVHSVADYPPFVLFWTFSFRGLSAGLRELGFEAAD